MCAAVNGHRSGQWSLPMKFEPRSAQQQQGSDQQRGIATQLTWPKSEFCGESGWKRPTGPKPAAGREKRRGRAKGGQPTALVFSSAQPHSGAHSLRPNIASRALPAPATAGGQLWGPGHRGANEGVVATRPWRRQGDGRRKADGRRRIK